MTKTRLIIVSVTVVLLLAGLFYFRKLAESEKADRKNTSGFSVLESSGSFDLPSSSPPSSVLRPPPRFLPVAESKIKMLSPRKGVKEEIAAMWIARGQTKTPNKTDYPDDRLAVEINLIGRCFAEKGVAKGKVVAALWRYNIDENGLPLPGRSEIEATDADEKDLEAINYCLSYNLSNSALPKGYFEGVMPGDSTVRPITIPTDVSYHPYFALKANKTP